ncbi:GIY-YIG nuclease family protein [Actinoplanes sp. NPDC026619]|uniref:GIY-YIG nuclease family protein n=1 Tax=Actinoplanes sp. NPDC026619 TaxID=3155798 RepID=UPI0033EA036A
MSRKAASRKIEQLRRDYRGSKALMTDPEYPRYDPHSFPGVYFVVEYPDRFNLVNGGKPHRFKIGESKDPILRLPTLNTGNPGELHLAHVIYEPDERRRRVLETELKHDFRDLGVAREWFRWTDGVDDYVSSLCREQCWDTPDR